jgi:hypothetical protein
LVTRSESDSVFGAAPPRSIRRDLRLEREHFKAIDAKPAARIQNAECHSNSPRDMIPN